MHNDHSLYFSPSERRGILLLLLICVLMHIVPNVYSSFMQAPPLGEDSLAFQQFVASVSQVQAEHKPTLQHHQQDELFLFNPNTLDEVGWQRLGINENTARRIRKYVAKGGRFKKKEDLFKIYGLPEAQAERLMPYVQLPKEERVQQSFPDARPQTSRKVVQQPVDINLADSALFESLPGIGPVLAKRIVVFRTKLGGFHEVQQVGETFGLADSTFRKIQPRLVRGKETVKQININTAAEEMLRAHPYIGYKKAAAIIRYRKEHGEYSSWVDLEKLVILTPSDIQKLRPYLVFE
ncbi:MAG TPA: helix-hairpin-helix domain-containing protein [Ferruginibacter sp.]|nr:helix-hairpin-helix domain-containing protein [Ferruginibacter sp.]HRO05187.1 helix-hairpin-helix domain-containing protein [Ferruginibacter sp.]HRO95508.1 helix-hairpin-helix domain-containing protein [Ferruginibacter sp.]HRP50279.1 helix-hairpin-helix domain-containing protein [Ferruginibacter sp.]